METINSFNGDVALWALVDPTAHESLPALLQTSPVVWPLYLNTYSQKLMVIGPHMLPLATNSDLTVRLLESMETLPLGLISGCLPGREEHLYEHFQRRLEYSFPDGRQGIFRFYDPRMAYGLATYPATEARSHILGPALFLAAWEPGRQRSVLILHDEDTEIETSDDYMPPSELIEHIWKEAHIHSLIGGLKGEPGRRLNDMPLAEAYKLLEAADGIIKEQGYLTYDDLALAAALTTLSGLEFWNRNDVRLAMTQGRAKQLSLKSALEGSMK